MCGINLEQMGFLRHRRRMCSTYLPSVVMFLSCVQALGSSQVSCWKDEEKHNAVSKTHSVNFSNTDED